MRGYPKAWIDLASALDTVGLGPGKRACAFELGNPDRTLAGLLGILPAVMLALWVNSHVPSANGVFPLALVAGVTLAAMWSIRPTRAVVRDDGVLFTFPWHTRYVAFADLDDVRIDQGGLVLQLRANRMMHVASVPAAQRDAFEAELRELGGQTEPPRPGSKLMPRWSPPEVTAALAEHVLLARRAYCAHPAVDAFVRAGFRPLVAGSRFCPFGH